MHGGTQLPGRKWNVECLDGEAMVSFFSSICAIRNLDVQVRIVPGTNQAPVVVGWPYYPYAYDRTFL